MMTDPRQLIVDNIPNLRQYAYALLRDRDLANDLVQDCLERAMGRLHLWEAGSNMRAWLFSILHNLYVNSVRRQTHQPDKTSLEPIHEISYSMQADQEQVLAVQYMERALEQLPADQKEVLLLIGLQQLTYSEVADILDVPVGTVMSRLNRGRAKLREIMDASPSSSHIRRIK